MNLILIPIVLPIVSALALLLISERTRYLKELLAAGVSVVTLLAAVNLFLLQPQSFDCHWLGAMNFTLRTDSLSAFVMLAVSLFSAAVAVYSFSFQNKGPSKWFFFSLLMTQGFSSGAVLADNLVAMLFFWEGLLVFLYVFIALSQDTHAAKRAAMKAFLINAVTDLCLLAGITITGYIAGTMSMSEIASNKLTLDYGWSIFAYVLLMIGAVSKAGAFPFHTWMPDAATDSSAPFMAFIPSSIDKLLGVYFLARASIYLFTLNGAMQLVLMTLGALTIIIAMMMAVVQTDYRRLLTYSTVGQTGYMILGIGTLNPIGIAGGLFHMINHATYKSALFMTSGAVERQAGTSDMSKLGGLFRAMPVTGLCFLVAAAAISGIAPLNGFFSKELIFRGTLSTGYTIFFIIAEIGSFLTLASLLKLGHAVFFGPRPENLKETRESPFSMLLPMLALAGICLAFGFGGRLPMETFISPALQALGLPSGELWGFHPDKLFFISVIVILAAVINHMLGLSAAGGKAADAANHIRFAPGLKGIYDMAERKTFDIYEQAMERVVPAVSRLLFRADRALDWALDTMPSGVAGFLGGASRRFHNGSYPLYLALTLCGAVAYLIILAGQNGGLK